jgi:hypothetical protein
MARAARGRNISTLGADHGADSQAAIISGSDPSLPREIDVSFIDAIRPA